VEERIVYKQLYELQDRILKIIFDLEHSFYLTGGTALHRFYYNYRYSDDLDFFSADDPVFAENISMILNAFREKGVEYNRVVQARDFQRVIIQGILQLDFVNDRVYREGKSNIVNGIRIDNKINILTNKIAAIMNRDEEKDIFDLCAISYNEKFVWGEIFKIVNKKAHVERSFFVERLMDFPVEWLLNLKTIETIKIDHSVLETICQDVISESDNSLYKLIV